MNPDKYRSPQARPPNRPLHPSTTKKEKTEHRDVFSSKRGSVSAHLRGMRPAPTRQKDTLMLWEKLKL